MSSAAKSVLARFGSLVSHVLIYAPDQFVAFGAPGFDDLVVRGSLERRSKAFGLFTAHGATDDSPERCGELFGMVRDLTDQGFSGSFNLTAEQAENHRQCIKKMDATHVRFHSERNGIHVSIFDFRRFEYASRIPRSKEVRLVVDTISKQDAYTFTATLMASTFLKLPQDTYSISVGRTGIFKLSSSSAGLDYLIRDQGTSEPVSFATNAQLASGIALWLQSKTSEQEIRTTQPLDPLSESEQELFDPSLA